MGLRDKRRELIATKEDRDEDREARDADPVQRWEYLARNLDKVVSGLLENDFNEHGAKGWEFVATAKGYAIFKRPIS